ncbi:hypothetical protein, partial [Aeromonas caviae]|uniref:hypothetical protein n=1 Tax=Aeromonas caviae TaxID=648 RepID=UPI0038D0D0E4
MADPLCMMVHVGLPLLGLPSVRRLSAAGNEHKKGAVPIMCWKANLEVGHHREDLHHGYASLPTPVVPLSITY